MKRYFGYLGIKPVGDLAQTAKMLGEALGGLTFTQDHEHKYDEFPAFVAISDGIEYALLGNPDPQKDLRDNPTSDFELQVRSKDEISGAKTDISMQLIEKISNDGRVRGWALRNP